jgi:hypothetical protein
MRAPCHVGEGLVDGDALDGRREIAQDFDGGVTEPLVFVEMSADKHEVGTEFPRAPPRHAASYAEGPGFVGGRENDAAADRNRLAAQASVKQLFDRRIKGVEVRVENGGRGNHLVDSLLAFSAPEEQRLGRCSRQRVRCIEGGRVIRSGRGNGARQSLRAALATRGAGGFLDRFGRSLQPVQNAGPASENSTGVQGNIFAFCSSVFVSNTSRQLFSSPRHQRLAY